MCKGCYSSTNIGCSCLTKPLINKCIAVSSIASYRQSRRYCNRRGYSIFYFYSNRYTFTFTAKSIHLGNISCYCSGSYYSQINGRSCDSGRGYGCFVPTQSITCCRCSYITNKRDYSINCRWAERNIRGNCRSSCTLYFHSYRVGSLHRTTSTHHFCIVVFNSCSISRWEKYIICFSCQKCTSCIAISTTIIKPLIVQISTCSGYTYCGCRFVIAER